MICTNCNKEIVVLKKETAALIMLTSIPLVILISGFNSPSLLYAVIFLAVGLKWLIQKPSRSFACEECKIALAAEQKSL
jgi:hypothetical protein